MQTSEQELIARSVAHDADAYGQLVDRYKRAIYRHCFALLRDEDAAEDVAQDTFIAAYYKLTSFDQSRKFSTWLFKISTNKCLDTLKARKRFVDNEKAVFEAVAPKSYDAHRAAQDDEVAQAVARLKPTYRVVVTLYYFEGKSYDEIAELMGKPLGSIKAWMNRAKKSLRKELV
jgi:RNA polymerase sigma-70 factor (ECF subfamily)